MRRLIQQLKLINEQHPVTAFKWDVPEKTCPIQLPAGTTFERNVYLKEHLKEKMANDATLASHYWAIQDWGGIGSFKRTPDNDARIRKFLQEVGTGTLTRESSDVISSLSKVASFVAPDQYVIYDSRVIYALNWLLFNWTDQQELFPQPPGRSVELAKYDMATLFRLSGRHITYRSPKTAFHDYCALVRSLVEPVFGPGSRPYLLEMLLFQIAPGWVVQDVGRRVALTISP